MIVPESQNNVAVGSELVDLASVYRSQVPRLLRFLRRRTRDGDDPADLVQEAFTRLAGSATTSLMRNPEAYLQRIVRNLLIDRSRRAASGLEVVALEVGHEVAVAPDQCYAIEANDTKRLYRAAVTALPPRTRQVFLLHRVDERPYRAIADELGISIRTVEWHVAEALFRIGKALGGE